MALNSRLEANILNLAGGGKNETQEMKDLSKERSSWGDTTAEGSCFFSTSNSKYMNLFHVFGTQASGCVGFYAQ